MSHYSRNKVNNDGFTLIELLISISIMTIILTVVVLNQPTYTDNIALSNLADEIGLTLSQAQAYGIGVKEFSPSSDEFSASYGLTFSLLSGSNGSNKAYIFFGDRNADNIYGGNWSCPLGGTSECLNKIKIVRGNYIDPQGLCIVVVTGTDLCDVGRMDISFVRPSTEAKILFFNSAGGSYLFDPTNIKGARVLLKSPSGSSRSVTVYTTGQISIQ